MLDVTPVGSEPRRRRRGWIRVVLGLTALLAGIVLAIGGIVAAIADRGRIESDAVAHGTFTDGRPSPPVAFRAPEGGAGDYTVYLLLGGVHDDDLKDITVRDTDCVASLADRSQHGFTGARQGVAMTLGSASSVGSFSAQPGPVAVLCAYGSGSRYSFRHRPQTVSFVVTPGRPAAAVGGILAIVAGLTIAIGGGFLAGVGWFRGRRN